MRVARLRRVRGLREAAVIREDQPDRRERASYDVPYGRSSRLRHVVGGSKGGGFEWTAGPRADSLAGITAIELDAEGLITRITSVYDSRQLEPDRKAALIGAAFGHSQ